ncbi:amino acid ABC transporter permease [Clostridium sp. chh4-2]|uniref:amino acid ABC transporter permease n=1 Tax=Clostridium sp. chh4-2 TaxID=2067550 RepID=UPI000CCDE7FA|nr:amino acid ABC transporter permease [Clostridium sp. chh4-2]PNV62637.1 amino acid ABC transporter permease [Clostridium sp. chh4-2]
MGDVLGSIFTKANFLFMMQGLGLTIIIALFTIVLSLIFGTGMALIRHFCRGKAAVFSGLAGAYIEFFRCTPNILWILWIRFTVQGNANVKAVLACTLFTTAVVAEIVRGGLNGIPKGQFESAASQGFSFWQTLFYIVLPQTYKSIIPALLSQVITIIKDTSFLKVVDIAEFMRNSTVVMGQLRSSAQIVTLYGFIALVYFMICFSLSCGVRYYQKKITV